MPVRSFSGFRPSPRYDDVPWNRIRIEEAADVDNAPGSFSVIDTITLSPLDSDPERPTARNVTTDNATLVTGWYKLVFLDASDNEDPSDPVPYPGSGYPSPSELVAESVVEALTGLAYEYQEALWLAAKLAVEEYTGQQFTFEEDATKQVDGRGGRTLYLPKRLETLTTLEVSGSGLDQTQVYLSDTKDSLHVTASAGFGTYYERALWSVQGEPALCFTYGVGTVTINGDWGWEEFPLAIRNAMRYDMEDQALADTNSLMDTIRAYQKMGIRDASQGGLAFSVTAAAGLSDRVRTLLDGYVYQGAVGVSV